MKRGLTVVFVVLGLAGAGFVAAPVFADPPASVVKKFGAAKPASHAKPVSHAVPASIRIAGIRVGGLTPEAAAGAVKTAFAKPLTVFVDGARLELHPAKLATAYIDSAVGHARSAAPGTNVHLTVSAHGAAIRSAVAHLVKRFGDRPRSASLALKHGRPYLTREVTGHRLDESALVVRIVRSLTANIRLPLHVRTKTIKPTVTASGLGPVILINRSKNRLSLFRGNELWRSFPVATGQAIYPTPAGRFDIVVKWVNPWWYPPTYDAWAKGLSPVPPGPGNPLGTRWMGLSAPGVGIHGTNNPSSIGYSASHGCIRMQVADSEWLFQHVNLGTTVFIT